MDDLIALWASVDIEPEEITPAPTQEQPPSEEWVGRRRRRELLGSNLTRYQDEVAPNPPKYVNGWFHYLPIQSAVDAMHACTERVGRVGFLPICITCQSVLESSHWTDQWGEQQPMPIERIFGAASDHARITLNHAVVVLHTGTNLPVWMSPYDPVKTCAGAGSNWEADGGWITNAEMAGKPRQHSYRNTFTHATGSHDTWQ